MGFFSKIKDAIDFVRETVTEVSKCVKEVAECVREIKGAVVDGIKELLGLNIKKINDANNIASKKLGEMGEYNPEKASTSQTKELQNMLDKFKNPAIKASKNFESGLIDIGQNSIKALVKTLSAENKENFATLCQKELDNIKGILTKQLASKVSLANKQCLQILALDSGVEKEKQMKEFIANSVKKAFRAIGDSFSKGINANVETMTTTLQRELKYKCDLRDNQLATLRKIKEANSVEQKQSEQTKLAFDLSKQIKLFDLVNGGVK